MNNILKHSFTNIDVFGVFGNKKIMRYYDANKRSVEKFRRWDVFSLEQWMPRWMLQIPYDVLNRINRHKLQDSNKKLVDNIKHTDYFIDNVSDDCLDFLCVATK